MILICCRGLRLITELLLKSVGVSVSWKRIHGGFIVSPTSFSPWGLRGSRHVT